MEAQELDIIPLSKMWNGREFELEIEDSKLLDSDGYKCCMGEACLFYGVDPDVIKGEETIKNLVEKRVLSPDQKEKLDLRFLNSIYEINDNKSEEEQIKYNSLDEKVELLNNALEGRKASFRFQLEENM